MLKKLSIICLITIAITANAQVIKPGKSRNAEQSNSDFDNSAKDKKPLEFKRSLIQINIFEFVFTNVALSYQIFSKDGKSGFQIPFTFGIGGKPDSYNYVSGSNNLFIVSQNRIFESGLHYHYYFVGQKKASPFIGVGVNIGAFNYWTSSSYNNSYPYYYQQTPTNQQVGTNFAGSLFGGVLINPNETITFGFKGGLGFMRRATNISGYQEYTNPYALLEINLGFKF